VIDIPAAPRYLLVNGIVAPFRSPRSAKAYAEIWTAEGSPLIAHSRRLSDAVQARLGSGWQVAVGMRYGAPSTAEALKRLTGAGCSSIAVMPLYPQYSSATTGSSLEEVGRAMRGLWNVPAITTVPAFFADEGYLAATAAPIAACLAEVPDAHVLFSFHGLPERQVRKGDRGCLQGDCCAAPKPFCYKSQCMATAKALAARLDLGKHRWSVGFQSRLGREPWLGPNTVDVAKDLAGSGHALVVAAPSFVADCLETLEELGGRLKASFQAAGGGEFRVAPCPNASAAWVDAVARMACEALPRADELG
jgi:ferrochelatase